MFHSICTVKYYPAGRKERLSFNQCLSLVPPITADVVRAEHRPTLDLRDICGGRRSQTIITSAEGREEVALYSVSKAPTYDVLTVCEKVFIDMEAGTRILCYS